MASPEADDAIPEVVPADRVARRLGMAILALMVFAVAIVLWLEPQNFATPGASEASIAVLPLAVIGGAPEDTAVVDGLTDALIASLRNIPDLRVVPRTSSFVFRNSSADVRRIADSLHVSNILEGSVQKSGSRVRVEVRLVSASDGATRWSETYDREFSDVFAMQTDIATQVARELEQGSGQLLRARIRPR